MRFPFRPAGYLLGALLLAATGCLGDTAERETEVTLSEAFAFELVGRGQRTALDTTEATEVAIRTAEAWTAYQDSLTPLQPFNPVDFSQEMVLLAAVPVPAGGYGVEVETVEKQNDSLLVHYRLSTPGYDCMTALGRAIPFQAVRVGRTDAPVRFVQEQETYRCTEDRGIF